MKEIFNNILIPYNGCKGSQKAFKKAIKLAQLTQSKITVLTCVEGRSVFGFLKPKSKKQEFEHEKKSIIKEYEHLESYAKSHNISLDFKILKSDLPYETILEFADSNDIDLIVLGINSRSTYERIHYPHTVENIVKSFQGTLLIIN